MVTTKAIFAEQILRILNGGFPSERDRVLEEEIKLAITDISNFVLKTEILNISYNLDNGSIIEGSAIVTYENIKVKRSVPYGDIITATADMPATPMMLPDQSGVFQVYPSGRPHLQYKYIPSGMVSAWLNNKVVSPLHKNLFTWNSGKITIFNDLFGQSFDEIDVQLVVSPLEKAGDNDPLPLSPELRDKVLIGVLARFGYEPKTVRKETDQPSPQKNDG